MTKGSGRLSEAYDKSRSGCLGIREVLQDIPSSLKLSGLELWNILKILGGSIKI